VEMLLVAQMVSGLEFEVQILLTRPLIVSYAPKRLFVSLMDYNNTTGFRINNFVLFSSGVSSIA
jgi:hypothetical protein